MHFNELEVRFSEVPEPTQIPRPLTRLGRRRCNSDDILLRSVMNRDLGKEKRLAAFQRHRNEAYPPRMLCNTNRGARVARARAESAKNRSNSPNASNATSTEPLQEENANNIANTLGITICDDLDDMINLPIYRGIVPFCRFPRTPRGSGQQPFCCKDNVLHFCCSCIVIFVVVVIIFVYYKVMS